jgi:hypothetical protein
LVAPSIELLIALAAHVRDSIPQVRHQTSIVCSRIAATMAAIATAYRCGASTGVTAGYTRNNSPGSIRHCPSSSRVALMRPLLMARRMLLLFMPVAVAASASDSDVIVLLMMRLDAFATMRRNP